MDTLRKTKEILSRYNISAKKSYGQNFLISDEVLFNISKLANVNNNDLIIEIGPGLGNLTEYLCSSKMLLVEIDDRMIEILNDRFKGNDNINLINKDILKINLDDEIDLLEKKYNMKFNKVKVVANLPYYITSPILFKLFEDSTRINEIIVMVQEEVADRIVAKTKSKDYSVLTVMVNYFGEASKEIIVPNNSFIPAPNVSSAVVRIDKNCSYNVNYILFKELVHKSFLNRRKKLLNSLFLNNFNNFSKDELINLFNNCDISLNTRAEEVSLDKYIEIVKYIENM